MPASMRRLCLVLLLAGCAAPPSTSPPGPAAEEGGRRAHTYSIVARDPRSGELGVAVQSHWFSVGSLVPWAEAGVGAVATQSLVEPSYGPKGLSLMKEGLSAPQALARLMEADAGREVRQVAMVDAAGRVAVHTGSRCIAAAGHRAGEGFSVQANLMLNDDVVPAMARAFEEAKGELAERMAAAMEAAQAAGGDIRGQQSAALLVVRGKPTGEAWRDIEVSLRVEDHPRPVEELRRLLRVHRSYERMRAGDAALARGDLEEALSRYREGAGLAPGNPELLFWPSVELLKRGKRAEARALLREVIAIDPKWKDVLRRLPRAGLLPDDEAGRKALDEVLKDP